MAKPINYDNPAVKAEQLKQLKTVLERECGPLHVAECMMGQHEPDEELEKLPFDTDAEHPQEHPYIFEVLNNKDSTRRIRVRICKHCGCLYAEKA